MKPITKSENEKKCFIIMPITTPENWVDKYLGDEEHFNHVLEELLIPAVVKAGFEPISPKTKGAELIQGDIIRKIESADFVLCDMSTLNPNVFFELGIRTSLNKPVCMIKDDLTGKDPFDTSSINNHTYLSALHSWTQKEQIEALANHIKDSFEIRNDSNSLWKYFGLSSSAQPINEESSDAKIDFLIKQVGVLREQLSVSSKVSLHTKLNGDMIDKYLLKLGGICANLSSGLENPSVTEFHNTLYLLFESLDQLEIIIKNSGLTTKEVSDSLEIFNSLYIYDPRKYILNPDFAKR